jgi:hypothetical protein
MRYLALLPVLALACNPGGGDSTDTGTETSAGASTGGPTGDPSTGPGTSEPDPTTGSASGTDSDSATDATTAGPTSSTDTGETTDPTATSTGDTTSTDTTDTTDTGDTTTGGVLGCNFEGPEVEAELVKVGEPPAPCGTLEFDGRRAGPGLGPVYQLDGCPCDSECLIPEPWQFTVDVPQGHLPKDMPECPRIVVQRQMSKMGCELVGAAIWDLGAADPEVPRWVAGSLLGPLDAVKPGIDVAQTTVEECDCGNCCGVPERYDLEFSVGDAQLVLGEDSAGKLGGYDVRNFQSHLTGVCDQSPSIDWIMQKSP